MIKQKLVDCKREKGPIEKNLKLITGKIEKAKKYRTSLNDKIKERKIRKRSGDGIESKMLVSLKLFGIEVQAYYHGGSLHGKDVQKLMSNASDIFKSFADTLKKCKKDDCKLRDKEIDDICQSYANLCVLWDCAFSFASKKGPMKNDIVMYQRFVTADVHSHVALGLNVTPKVHLMWRHVARQMQLTGGLGYKREDWVEKGHQTSSQTREQHRHNVDVKNVPYQWLAYISSRRIRKY